MQLERTGRETQLKRIRQSNKRTKGELIGWVDNIDSTCSGQSNRDITHWILQTRFEAGKFSYFYCWTPPFTSVVYLLPNQK